MDGIEKAPLLEALGTMLSERVQDAEYACQSLQGGTVGEVWRVSGTATAGGGKRPFSLVVKSQRKWDRPGDPDCWRREHAIYKNGLAEALPSSIRLPKCYRLEEGEGITRIWMEDIAGRTGNERLGAGELALAAERLGFLQAEFHRDGPRDLPYLRPCPAVRPSFDLWYGRMRGPLGAAIDGFPEEVRRALNGHAERADGTLAALDGLPLTLCQGDVHHDNLILREGPRGTEVYLIDWDCAGYGRMGEDAVDALLEAFVYSDRDVSLLPEFRRRIFGAYAEGARRGGLPFSMEPGLASGLFALSWGFRIADLYLYYREEAAKRRCVEILRGMLGV